MKTLRYYILLIALICTQVIFAQVSFEATASRDNIPLNDNVRIDFTMNQDGDNFAPPRFDNFTIVDGPNQSVSTSWSNGKRSFSKTYFYFLQPKKKGTFTIGAACIEIDGQMYKTKPISVTVSDALSVQESRQNKYKAQIQALQNIHLVADVNNYNPYINEPLTITYKLYFNINIGGFRGDKIPTFNKCLVHNVELTSQFEPKVDKYKGKDITSIVLKQDVLMPQKAGTLTINPMILTVNAEVPTGRRDFSGYPETSFLEEDYSTDKIKINVKPLPKKDKPKNFSQGVGTFDFKVTPSALKVKVGEELTIKLEVTGIGNIPIIELPPLTINNIDITLSNPEKDDKIEVNETGITGNIYNTYTLTPQQVGTFTINPLEFTYFDPQKEKYITILSDSITITVTD